MDTNKYQIYIVRFFIFLLVAAVIGNVMTQNWLNLFTSILALILIFLPTYFSNIGYIYIPTSFQFVMIVFIFAALYLGELRSFYLRFWWWDSMLHMLSGIILGFIGFILVYILNKEENINVVLSPVFIAMFSFCFAVTIGVFWEIFEYWMDTIFALNMQKSGIVDTMWDLMEDCVGAFITSTVGYFYIKTQKTSRFQEHFVELIEKNKDKFIKH
ncbi:MAG: hypothetical protein ACQESS_07625 [Bacillota bacterium]